MIKQIEAQYAVNVVIPASGSTTVDPWVLPMTHEGGSATWFISCGNTDVKTVIVEIEGDGSASVILSEDPELPGPFQLLGQITIAVPPNTGDSAITYKYTVTLKAADETPIEVIDPYIIVDKP